MARGGESAARWYSDRLREAHRTERKLLDENAKLREELDQWHSLTAGIELPEYPITQFQPKDLERENAKLRELVRDMWHEGAFEPGACYAKATDRLEERTRELGIEVDNAC